MQKRFGALKRRLSLTAPLPHSYVPVLSSPSVRLRPFHGMFPLLSTASLAWTPHNLLTARRTPAMMHRRVGHPLALDGNILGEAFATASVQIGGLVVARAAWLRSSRAFAANVRGFPEPVDATAATAEASAIEECSRDEECEAVEEETWLLGWEESWEIGWEEVEVDDEKEASDAAASAEPPSKLEVLNGWLADAVADEDYERASSIKVKIDDLQTPRAIVPKLQSALDEAVKREDYQEAGRIKTELDSRLNNIKSFERRLGDGVDEGLAGQFDFGGYGCGDSTFE